MSEYSITIEIPEYVVMDKKPKTKVVPFNTKEDKDMYVLKENIYTVGERFKINCAYSRNSIAGAWEKLYHSRLNFYHAWAKDTATTTPKRA